MAAVVELEEPRRDPDPGPARGRSRACPRRPRRGSSASRSRNLLGSVAPTGAKGYLPPAVTLDAPQTTCLGVPEPSSTVQRRRRSALGWARTSSTSAITTSPSPGCSGSIASTGAPSMVSRSASSVASSGRRRKASSQRRETFISRAIPNCAEEPHVALVEQPDVGDRRSAAWRSGAAPCRRPSRCSARGRRRSSRAPPGAPCRSRGSPSSRCPCRRRSPSRGRAGTRRPSRPTAR